MSEEDLYPQNSKLSFDELYDQAVESKPLLESFGNKVLEELRQEFPGKFDDAEIKVAKTKDKDRAWEKIESDYFGNCSEITDLTRGRIVVNTVEEADLARQYFKEHEAELNLQEIKDRFEKPSDTNYRDVLTTIKLENGHVAEFRVEHAEMIEAGNLTHFPYEVYQDFDRRGTELTPEQAYLTHLAFTRGTDGVRLTLKFDGGQRVGEMPEIIYFLTREPFQVLLRASSCLQRRVNNCIGHASDYLEPLVRFRRNLIHNTAGMEDFTHDLPP